MYVLFPETNAAETTAQDSIFLFAERLHAAVGRLDLADQPFGAHLFQTIPVTVGLVSLVEVLRVPASVLNARQSWMNARTEFASSRYSSIKALELSGTVKG